MRITAAEARRLARMSGKAAGVSKPAQAAKKGRAARGEPAGHPGMLLSVKIKPQTKQRARTFMPKQEIERAFFKAQGNIGRFREALAAVQHRTVTPAETRQFEAEIAAAGKRAMGGAAPLSCPVEMEIHFVFAGDPATWPTAHSDGDLDNLEKAVKDALNKVAYEDDRQVVRKSSIKECGPEDMIVIAVRPAG